MARAQTGLEQLLAQSRQQSESTIFEEQFILHPHCESRMSLLCTFKIITKSRCFNGSGALRRPRPVTCTCGAIGSARSDAGGDIAARCPYPLNTYAGTAGEAPRILAVIALSLGSFLLPLLLLFFLGRRGEQ